MKKSELRQIIKEEISKTLDENNTQLLKKGDNVKILQKLGNILSRAIDTSPNEWPQKDCEYEIVDDIGSYYGFKTIKGKPISEEPRFNDKKWIDNQIKSGKIEIIKNKEFQGVGLAESRLNQKKVELNKNLDDSIDILKSYIKKTYGKQF